MSASGDFSVPVTISVEITQSPASIPGPKAAAPHTLCCDLRQKVPRPTS
ncbi:hypothetical protein JHY03_72770 (plasmid) [Streptomyces sp. CA-256286]|nr:hypothetical protein JHY03_72750 [Streptomyces sp. CA-256286]QTA37061.1 hypothetical protein JHY03_72770 [Streptomyces sp. CA-256286]